MSLWNLITDRSAADLQRLRDLLSELEATATPTTAQLDELRYGPVPEMIDPDTVQFTDPGGEGFTLLGQNQNGSYGATDLNRVGTAGLALRDALLALPGELQDYAEARGVAWANLFDVGYEPPTAPFKTDWYIEDENTMFSFLNQPMHTYMSNYLGSLNALRNCLPAGLPDLPESMAFLTLDGANAIERMLFALSDAIEAKRAEIKGYIDQTVASWKYCGEAYCGEG